MIKKSFIPVVTILFLVSSVLAEMQVAEVAEANFIPYPSTPSTELPSLIVQTPEEYSSLYANNTLELSFTVIKPESWNSYYNGWLPYVGTCNVYVYLDGILKQDFPATKVSVDDFNVVFGNLTSQQHTVKIDVYALTYSQIGAYNSNVTQTIFFTISADSQTISFSENPVLTIRGLYPTTTPSSSLNPTLTLTPTSTPSPSATFTPTITTTPTESNFLLNQAVTVIVVIIILIVASSVLIIYLKAHHKKVTN